MTDGFRAVVYLDRDGTVIEEVNYLARPEQVRLIPGAGEAIARLNAAQVAVVLTTNQAGVAHGYFSEEMVWEVHRELGAQLAAAGAWLDCIEYCPHHPEGLEEAYRLACRCRKPGPGLVEQALQRLPAQVSQLPAFGVGDKALDVGMAQAVGAQGILVLTGYGARACAAWPADQPAPVGVVADLPEAVALIEALLASASTLPTET